MRIGVARVCIAAAGASMLMAAACRAQNPLPARPIGTVAAADATITSPAGSPSLQAVGGRDVLLGSATVTAKDHTAPIDLERGGQVLACLGTAVHLAEEPDGSLLLGLDRGAMEVKIDAKAGDVVMTPDLRFSMSEPPRSTSKCASPRRATPASTIAGIAHPR